MVIGFVVPVLSNFKGLAELMHSVDVSIRPVIIENWRDNLGVSKSWNTGIQKCLDLDAVVVVNDDVIFYPQTISKLVSYLDDYDLVSANASETGQTGVHAEHFPDFCCFAIKPKDFVEKFGTFDENFSPAYFEDNDMDYRIKLGGGKKGIVLEARVDHEGSVTQFKGSRDPNTNDRVVSHDMFRQNREYYMAKWGGPPGQEIYQAPFNGMTGRTFREWHGRG